VESDPDEMIILLPSVRRLHESGPTSICPECGTPARPLNGHFLM